MKRRKFIQAMGAGVAATGIRTGEFLSKEPGYVRLGGPLQESFSGPGEWISILKERGYRAAYCPVKPGENETVIREYERAAMENDMVIAEVGAWSNLISPDREEAGNALEKCIRGLELAERIGARCCVNVSGSRNREHWAGPHKENLTPPVFDMVVEVTRKIIDAVNPVRTVFALEAMPWSFPDSTESYLQLLKAVDRKGFGVHIDPVNFVRSPREYFNNGALIREMFAKLGPHIRSCHAKDITLREDNYIPQLDELRPGLGNLDYSIYLRELARLRDVPLMMEHLSTGEEYQLAAAYIRSVAAQNEIAM